MNVLLHAANSVLVFLLVGKIQDSLPPQGNHGGWRVPALASLIFVLHPLQTESVVYIYQRSTLLAAFFSLLALILWSHRTVGDRRLLISLASFICFILAALAKEHALVLPIVLWAYDFYRSGRVRPEPILIASFAISLFLTGMFLWWSKASGDATIGAGGESLTYARTQVQVIWRYLRLFVLPLGQTIDPHVVPVRSWLAAGWWAQLILLISLLGTIALTYRSQRRFSFWLLFCFLWLLPTSSVVPSQDYMFEHRTYLPLLGLAGALSVLLARVSMSGWQFGGVAGLLAVTLGTVTWQRIQVWRSEVSLWGDAARKAPTKYRPVYNFGVTLMGSSPDRAEEYLRRAIQLGPAIPLAYRSLAELKWYQGDLKSAEELWQVALSLASDDRETLLALGRLHLEKKEFFAAENYLQRAATKQPTDWQARYLLGELYYGFGLTQKALDQAQEGLRFHPRADLTSGSAGGLCASPGQLEPGH